MFQYISVPIFRSPRFVVFGANLNNWVTLQSSILKWDTVIPATARHWLCTHRDPSRWDLPRGCLWADVIERQRRQIIMVCVRISSLSVNQLTPIIKLMKSPIKNILRQVLPKVIKQYCAKGHLIWSNGFRVYYYELKIVL